jgi:hypothetical protein
MKKEYNSIIKKIDLIHKKRRKLNQQEDLLLKSL